MAAATARASPKLPERSTEPAAQADEKGPPVTTSAPAPQELSTLDAAKSLNVSHLVVAQEIDAGRLKSHQVGVDLRIALPDLVAYALLDRPSA